MFNLVVIVNYLNMSVELFKYDSKVLVSKVMKDNVGTLSGIILLSIVTFLFLRKYSIVIRKKGVTFEDGFEGKGDQGGGGGKVRVVKCIQRTSVGRGSNDEGGKEGGGGELGGGGAARVVSFVQRTPSGILAVNSSPPMSTRSSGSSTDRNESPSSVHSGDDGDRRIYFAIVRKGEFITPPSSPTQPKRGRPKAVDLLENVKRIIPLSPLTKGESIFVERFNAALYGKNDLGLTNLKIFKGFKINK